MIIILSVGRLNKLLQIEFKMKRGRADESRATPSTGGSHRRVGIRAGAASRNIDLDVHVNKSGRRTSGGSAKDKRKSPSRASPSPVREVPERREVHTRHARMKKENRNMEAMAMADRKNDILDEYFELVSRMYLGEKEDVEQKIHEQNNLKILNCKFVHAS